MKKLFLIFLGCLAITATVNAQEISKNALGLRFGNNDGLGAEVSFQRKLSKDNRLELNLGLRNNNNFDAYILVGLYQWVWNLNKGFNWYAGVGGGIGSYSFKNNYNKNFNNNYNNSNTYFLAAGDIGIEYLFDFPIQLALDFRPEFYLGDNYFNNYGSDIALSIRYRF